MKIIRIFIILIIIFVFLTVCSNKFSNYYYKNLVKLEKPRKIKTLKSHIIINKNKINFLGGFGIIGKYLILRDIKSDDVIKIFNLKTGEFLKSFGKKGRGPSEFIGVSDIISDPNNKNMFWVFDSSANEIKKFDLNKIIKNNFEPDVIIKFHVEIPDKIIIMAGEKIIASAITTEGRILEYDMSGKLIKRIGKIPLKIRNRRFSKQHSQGFRGGIICIDNCNKILIATIFGSIIEEYDMSSSKLVKTYYGPELFFPEYSIVPAGQYYVMAPNSKTRWGYVDIAHNKKMNKTFLLYSGIHFLNKKGRPNHGAYTNTIFVMNSNGRLSEELLLDKRVWSIKISEDGSVIYGAGENEVLRFVYGKTQ